MGATFPALWWGVCQLPRATRLRSPPPRPCSSSVRHPISVRDQPGLYRRAMIGGTRSVPRWGALRACTSVWLLQLLPAVGAALPPVGGPPPTCSRSRFLLFDSTPHSHLALSGPQRLGLAHPFGRGGLGRGPGGVLERDSSRDWCGDSACHAVGRARARQAWRGAWTRARSRERRVPVARHCATSSRPERAAWGIRKEKAAFEEGCGRGGGPEGAGVGERGEARLAAGARSVATTPAGKKRLQGRRPCRPELQARPPPPQMGAVGGPKGVPVTDASGSSGPPFIGEGGPAPFLTDCQAVGSIKHPLRPATFVGALPAGSPSQSHDPDRGHSRRTTRLPVAAWRPPPPPPQSSPAAGSQLPRRAWVHSFSQPDPRLARPPSQASACDVDPGGTRPPPSPRSHPFYLRPLTPPASSHRAVFGVSPSAPRRHQEAGGTAVVFFSCSVRPFVFFSFFVDLVSPATPRTRVSGWRPVPPPVVAPTPATTPHSPPPCRTYPCPATHR